MQTLSNKEHSPNKTRDVAVIFLLSMLALQACQNADAGGPNVENPSNNNNNSSETVPTNTVDYQLTETIDYIEGIPAEQEVVEETEELYSQETADIIEQQLSSKELSATVSLDGENKFAINVMSTVYENSLDFVGTVEESGDEIILTLTPAAGAPEGSKVLRVSLPIKVKASFPEVTPAPEPPATPTPEAPAIAPGIEIGRGFNAAELKEAIENGETLLNPDLTPEFVDALIDVLTNDQDGNPIDKVVTYDMVKDLQLGTKDSLEPVTGLHTYIGAVSNLRAFPEGIQVVKGNSDIKVYGFYLLTTFDSQNPDRVSTFVNISVSSNYAREDAQVGILHSNFGPNALVWSLADRLDDNDGDIYDISFEKAMSLVAIEGFDDRGYGEGEIVSGGWGVYGEENTPSAKTELKDFPNELNHLLYPDLQAAFEAWHNGEVNLVPVFAPGNIGNTAGLADTNVFDQQ